MSEPEGDFASVESDGFTVTSSTETPEQLESNLTETPAAEPDLSKAGSELGKAGAEAAAAKRAEGEDEAVAAKRRVAEEIAKTPEGQKKKLASDRVEEATRAASVARHQLAAERAARERERIELEQLRAERQGKAATDTGKAPTPQPAGDAQPKEEDFQDWAEYVEARARWAAREEFRSHQQQAAQQTYKAAEQQAIEGYKSKFSERLLKAAEADPAFYDKTRPLAEFLQTSFQAEENGEPITIKHIVSDEIFSSEHAPALMLHFVEHPDAFQLLAKLSPREIAREVAKLEARLEVVSTATPTTRPQVSKAHDPVRPVAGAPSIADAVPGEEASYEEHKRYYDAQDRKKAASRR